MPIQKKYPILSVRINGDDLFIVKNLAKRENVSISEYVRNALGLCNARKLSALKLEEKSRTKKFKKKP